MREFARTRWRRGFTVQELAATLICLLIAGSLLVSLTGATRDLSQAQVCADHLRQLFAGMTAYVNQYNSYPPHAPAPLYIAPETVRGWNTSGWDPNIGFIMTCGIGLEPPARDTATGHFKWYGVAYADLPDVCRCPAMPASLLDLANVELDRISPLESTIYNYALAYQTSGTCRAATTVQLLPSWLTGGVGGRNPAIPNPTGSLTARPVDNAQRGTPTIWVYPHKNNAPPDDPSTESSEVQCNIQAVSPAEVQSPGRTYYMADSRDYRPYKNADGSPGWPQAGTNAGYLIGGGNLLFMSARHYGYGNVMYLDGRVSRDGLAHLRRSNMDYNYSTDQANSAQWRASYFAMDIGPASIRGQAPIMPVLMVTGWEYFFDANGLKAR